MAKILWITECYPSKELPQYCIFLEQQIKALTSLGHKIDVFIPSNNENENKLISYNYNGINIYKIGYHNDRYNMFFSIGSKGLKEKLENIIEKEKYDILAVHIVSDKVYYIVNKVSKKYKVKNILTFHGLNVYEDYGDKHLFSKLYSYRKAFLFSKADAIIGVSNKVKEVVKKRIKKVPVYCIYNGVDTTLFNPIIKNENKNKNDIKIVSIGNLIPTKGFKYLIDGIKMIIDENKNVKLYILGRGKEESKLKKQVKQLNIEEYVEFIGYKPYEIVKSYLQKADIFILPSYFEAIGCVYLEAMACGLATIGVDGQGIDEIISDGQNGMLLKPKDSNSVYEKISTLILNDELRVNIGRNGRMTAEKFTWLQSAQNIEKVYHEILRQ